MRGRSSLRDTWRRVPAETPEARCWDVATKSLPPPSSESDVTCITSAVKMTCGANVIYHTFRFQEVLHAHLDWTSNSLQATAQSNRSKHHSCAWGKCNGRCMFLFVCCHNWRINCTGHSISLHTVSVKLIWLRRESGDATWWSTWCHFRVTSQRWSASFEFSISTGDFVLSWNVIIWQSLKGLWHMATLWSSGSHLSSS